MKVLVLDESKLVRERFVEMICRIKGVEIVGDQEDMRKAVKCIETAKPQVVLLDMRLLQNFGMDIPNKIKQGNPATKIILITDHPGRELYKIFKGMGVDFVFNKSLEFKKIVEVLTQLSGKIQINSSSEPKEIP